MDTTDIVVKAIRLSTAHMPCEEPDFGDLRFSETEFGYIVWPSPTLEAPPWLQKIKKYCLDNHIEIIEFDRDNYTFGMFQEYDW